ncbi:hypothetical protein B0H21DRAFT_490946 [Amylocystis lapponica]|nr:hypothetical protein B0H21DRAFT_490946 [Amylocystis lapponica]
MFDAASIVFSALRIYAIWSKSIPPVLAVLCLGLPLVVLSIYQSSQIEAILVPSPSPSLTRCDSQLYISFTLFKMYLKL